MVNIQSNTGNLHANSTLISNLPRINSGFLTKQIYIHVGPGKTGSSALQKYLLENRQQLLQQGIFYPAHSIDKSGISSGNFWSIYKETKNAAAEISAEKLNQLMADFEKQKAHTLILSSEAFFMRIPEITKLIPGARLICYLRSPIDNIESVYNQSVKRHGNSKTFAETFPQPNFAILRQLEAYLKSLRDERFILRYYHPDCFNEGSIINDFFKALDLPLPAPTKADQINPSYSLEALELKRRLNELSLSPLALLKLDDLLQNFRGTQEFSLLPPSDYAEFKQLVLRNLGQFFKLHPFPDSDCLISAIEREKQKPYYSQADSTVQSGALLLYLKNMDSGLYQYLMDKTDQREGGLSGQLKLWGFRLKSALYSLSSRQRG